MPRVLLIGVLLLAAIVPVAAQEESGPSARVDPSTGEVFVVFGDLLQDGGLVRALESGLPLRIRLTAELWRDGFFDSQEGEAEWGASVIYDPVARLYQVAFVDTEPVHRVETLAEATELLEETFEVTLRPGREGRYYYLAHLEVETLSLSDLEELQRWLRGDLAPVVEGERRVESAVASGVRRLFVRVIGLPAIRERLRTRAFEWDPGAVDGGRVRDASSASSGTVLPTRSRPAQEPARPGLRVLGVPQDRDPVDQDVDHAP